MTFHLPPPCIHVTTLQLFETSAGNFANLGLYFLLGAVEITNDSVLLSLFFQELALTKTLDPAQTQIPCDTSGVIFLAEPTVRILTQT